MCQRILAILILLVCVTNGCQSDGEDPISELITRQEQGWYAENCKALADQCREQGKGESVCSGQETDCVFSYCIFGY